MADVPSGYYQMKRIEELLPGLSQRQRSAFAAACAERVFPLLENDLADSSLCKSAIELAWRFAAGAPLDDKEAQDVAERCEGLVAELYEDDEKGATLSAVNAAIYALMSARKLEAKFAEAAAADAQGAAETDTIDRAVRGQYCEEEAEWQMRALDLAIATPAPTRDMFAPLAGEPQWLRIYRREKWHPR